MGGCKTGRIFLINYITLEIRVLNNNKIALGVQNIRIDEDNKYIVIAGVSDSLVRVYDLKRSIGNELAYDFYSKLI